MTQHQRPVFARIFSFSALLVSLFGLLIFFLCIGRPLLADPDIWWHLRNAGQLVQGHAFVQRDLYTFTVAGKPWINPEWLSELPYYFAWLHFSYRGLEVVTVAMIEAVILGVFCLCLQRSGNAKSALLACGFFLPMVSVSIGPRTLMFGWLCLMAELALLRQFREGKDRLWIMPVLFALWINAHGSWPIGIVLLLVFVLCGLFGSSQGSILMERWTGTQKKKLLSIVALSVAALFLNPYGWHLVAYPFHITFGHHVTTDNVEEWQTLNFHALRGRLTFGILALLLFLNMARRRAWPLHEILFVLISVLAAFTYTRFLIMAGIVVCPLLAREFTFFEAADTQNDKPILNFALIAVLLAIAATHIPSQADLQKQIGESYPTQAAAYLRSAPVAGPIFNDFGWGGYLEWTLPSTPFFIDSRADIFDERGVLQEYIDATGMRGTFNVLDTYKIRTLVFPKKDPIVYLLTHTPGWKTAYQDEIAIVLVRDDTP